MVNSVVLGVVCIAAAVVHFIFNARFYRQSFSCSVGRYRIAHAANRSIFVTAVFVVLYLMGLFRGVDAKLLQHAALIFLSYCALSILFDRYNINVDKTHFTGKRDDDWWT